MRAILGVAVLALVLTACGGGADEPTETKTVTATATPTELASPAESVTATPSMETTTPTASVSLRTSCNMLIPDHGGPMHDAQVIWNNDSLSEHHIRRTKRGIDSLERISLTAKPKLAVQLTVMADETQQLLDNAYDPNAKGLDTTAYRSAAYEVLNICEPELY
jgi:hypothetical protein